MKLSSFGEYGDGHKLEAIFANFRPKTLMVLDPFFASLAKKPSHATVP
jgi:hypothetical protein